MAVKAVKKVVREGGDDVPQDVTDLQVLVDSYPRYGGGGELYTWRGGKLIWQASFSHTRGDDGSETVELVYIHEAYTSRKRAAEDSEFSVKLHPNTGQWLARTTDGYDVYATPEEALDRLNAVYEGLPPERTSTVTISGLKTWHGVADDVIRRELIEYLRASRYFNTAHFDLRKIKVTRDEDKPANGK